MRSTAHSLNRAPSGTNPTSHEYMAMEPGKISPSVNNDNDTVTYHNSITMLSPLEICRRSLDRIQLQVVWFQYDHF